MRKAIIVFLRKDEQVLLLHSYQNKNREKIFWQGISGYVEEGESPAQAAVREAREELGIIIDPQDLTRQHTFTLPDTEFTVFTSQTWQGKMILQEEGFEELRWFPVTELPLDQMHPGDKNWLPNIL